MINRRIQFWGIPKSGTGHVCRYINSLPDAFFFIQPHLNFFARNTGLSDEYPEEHNDVVAGKNLSILESLLEVEDVSVIGFGEAILFPHLTLVKHWSRVERWDPFHVIRNPIDVRRLQRGEKYKRAFLDGSLERLIELFGVYFEFKRQICAIDEDTHPSSGAGCFPSISARIPRLPTNAPERPF